MAIQEFKQFFLRDAIESGGSYPDQEVGFPIEYQVAIPGGGYVTVKNRYLTEHYPSQDVFAKLFESLAFKLNVEDTATLTDQGLVKRGTLTQYTNQDVEDADGFTLVYSPEFIADAISDSVTISDITFDEATRIATVDFPIAADLLIDTHTLFHYGDMGTPGTIPAGTGKDLDYFIDTKENNSLYLRGAGDTWGDTGIDLRNDIKVTVTFGSYQLSQMNNGSWVNVGSPWTAGSGGNAEYTDNGDGTITLDWDGGTPDTITFDKNTEVGAQVDIDGNIELYNDDPSGVFVTVPGFGSISQITYGTGIPVNGTGTDNDTYIDTASGILYSNSGGITWNQEICFSQCSSYIPTYTFKATGSEITATSFGESKFPLIADDTLGTDESYDPDNVWQGANYTKLALTTGQQHYIYIGKF